MTPFEVLWAAVQYLGAAMVVCAGATATYLIHLKQTGEPFTWARYGFEMALGLAFVYPLVALSSILGLSAPGTYLICWLGGSFGARLAPILQAWFLKRLGLTWHDVEGAERHSRPSKTHDETRHPK